MFEKPLSVVLPVCNEANNIGEVIASIVNYLPSIVPDFEVICVDDGSTDATPAIIRSLAEKYPCLKIIRHPKNRGYGSALCSGFKEAHHPLIFFMDADRQFEISEINKLLADIGDFDIVIGIRCLRHDPLYRISLGKLYSFLVRLLFGIKLKDITCGFKLFHREVLDRIVLHSTEGSINAELLVKALGKGCRIKEVEIKHFRRTKGRPSGADLKALAGRIYETFRLWGELRTRGRRPA